MNVTLGHALEQLKVPQRALERYKENLHKAGRSACSRFPAQGELCERIVAEGGHNHLCTHRGSSARWYMDAQGLSDCFTTWVTEETAFRENRRRMG